MQASLTLVVENMPGAGGLVAAMHFAHHAKPDGLTLGMFSTGLVLHEFVTRDEDTALDVRVDRFAVVGSPSSDFSVCFFSVASGITDYEAWSRATTAPRMGVTGPGSGSYVSTMVVTHTLGLPIRPVVGYRGTAEIRQAMESGEVDGSCISGSSFETLYGPQDAYVVVVQAGFERAPDLAHVPAAWEFATNDEITRPSQGLGSDEENRPVLCPAAGHAFRACHPAADCLSEDDERPRVSKRRGDVKTPYRRVDRRRSRHQHRSFARPSRRHAGQAREDREPCASVRPDRNTHCA